MAMIKFGTDGWRAVIAREFTFANCCIVAQGIASYMLNQQLAKKGIVIGYDNRFMSREFARECARVLTGNGIKVFFLNKVSPTPVTAFAVQAQNAGGALMITASHNPPEYNGIKYIPEYAGPALPDVTDAIEREVQRLLEGGRIYELDIEEARGLDIFEEINVDDMYINHLNTLLQGDSFIKNPLKVVVDPMFGAGIGYLEQILSKFGCEVKAINNYRDALFGNSLPEPVDEILTDLKRAVVSYDAQIGLALDGDADRFGIIDQEGTFVTPNEFMYLLLHHLLKTRTFRGPVARTLATTHMLDRIARKNGLGVIETPVGFKYIGQCLREKGCMLGGEESGGMSIFGHIPEKDGILACLLAGEMLAYSGKSFSVLKAEFEQEYGTAVSRRVDIKVKEEKKEEIIAQMHNYNPVTVAGQKVESQNRTEGLKVSLKDESWFLIRPSGTEPLFRLYVETSDAKKMEKIIADVRKALDL
ncbi:MAG TPA: phosphoglucomutase/phosphomannomutase family protein [Syntrophomonadaceae bacterium]|mgnify:CR=1 FL=1|nr:phosphoglucomutase/phosphomannomutase family protein [Syntrophomonadaceae bacterium]HPR93875.1 phosphoglucomutase/phosphomannomutase family protein [Syntrophomonadaceae bacterium]